MSYQPNKKHGYIIIDAGYFYAMAIYDKHGVFVRTAPIITWCRGKTVAAVLSYAKQKRWKIVRHVRNGQRQTP